MTRTPRTNSDGLRHRLFGTVRSQLGPVNRGLLYQGAQSPGRGGAYKSRWIGAWMTFDEVREVALSLPGSKKARHSGRRRSRCERTGLNGLVTGRRASTFIRKLKDAAVWAEAPRWRASVANLWPHSPTLAATDTGRSFGEPESRRPSVFGSGSSIARIKRHALGNPRRDGYAAVFGEPAARRPSVFARGSSMARIKRHALGNPGRDGYGAVFGEPETRRPAPGRCPTHRTSGSFSPVPGSSLGEI